ncbi:chemotaxis protein CheD [Vampirovibrio sp.]|uniref:chemotaxis protein CheD n=1 Tax=Vampirovibrio sp. TaxID=2717857 RepID=UPI003593DDE5
MSMQRTEQVELGEIKVSDQKTMMFVLPNIGTGIAVTIFDLQNKVGGVAHIVLPESSLGTPGNDLLPGKYANLAVPKLLADFAELGGQKENSVVRLVGGAQLFNFGGGGGNILNIGARNATAIRAAMSKQGLAIGKADTGGNKGKSLRFVLATGQMFVRLIGGDEYLV